MVSIFNKMSNYLSGNIQDPEEFERRRKVLVLYLLLGLAVFFFSFFAVYRFINEEYLISIMNLLTDSLTIILLIFLKKYKKIRLTSIIGISFVGIHFAFLNLMNADHTISLIWTLAFPIMALFLLGRKEGTLAVILFIVGYHIIYMTFHQLMVITTYDYGFVIEYALAFTLIFLLAYLFEYVREKSQTNFVRSKNNLDDTIIVLQNTMNALRDSEVKYRTLVENASDGIVIVQDGFIVYSNKVLMEMLNVMEQDIIGIESQNFIANFEKDRIRRKMTNRLENSLKNETYETMLLGSTGLHIPVEINATLFSFNGRPAILGIIRDIMDRKVHEEEREALILELEDTRNRMLKDAVKLSDINQLLKESEQKLKNVINSKDKFISILSHDLVNPVSGCRQLTEMYYNEFDNFTEQERQGIVYGILMSLKNINNLLDNLLKWAKAQNGTLPFTPVEINLSSIIKSTFDLSEVQAKNKSIDLVGLVDENINVYADIEMIKLVFRNIISNAIKFTPNKGKITISAFENNNLIEVHCEDTGNGISKEYLSKLFRVDQRFSTLGTESEQGSGMGLILCKEFILLNGGNIWVESKVNEGTTFKFTLPKVTK